MIEFIFIAIVIFFLFVIEEVSYYKLRGCLDDLKTVLREIENIRDDTPGIPGPKGVQGPPGVVGQGYQEVPNI